MEQEVAIKKVDTKGGMYTSILWLGNKRLGYSYAKVCLFSVLIIIRNVECLLRANKQLLFLHLPANITSLPSPSVAQPPKRITRKIVYVDSQ